MNWFTKSAVVGVSVEKKAALATENDCCEHVEKDVSTMAHIRYENDPWGREGYCVCQECFDKSETKKGEEFHTCSDCKTDIPLKDGVMWKWYDFYAPQGDEPLFVCNECRKLENHQARVKRDTADCDYELGYDNQDDQIDEYPEDNFTDEEIDAIEKELGAFFVEEEEFRLQKEKETKEEEIALNKSIEEMRLFDEKMDKR